MNSKAQRIDQYIEAIRRLRAIEAGIADEGMTPARALELKEAKGDVKVTESLLSGGDKGKALIRMREMHGPTFASTSLLPKKGGAK